MTVKGYKPWWDGIGTFYFEDPNETLPVLKLKNWVAFSQLLQANHFEPSTGSWVFRGQGNAKWPLVSSLERKFENGFIDEGITERHLRSFKKASRGRANILLLDDNEIWAQGQHQGLATPLLDWTDAPYISLFFAFNELTKEPTPRAIYALNQTKLEELLPELFFEPETGDNSRLLGQSGLFTKAPQGDESLETFILNILNDHLLLNLDSERELASDFLDYAIKIVIPDSGRLDCIAQLEKMNIHWNSLFPDLFGASQHCNQLLEKDVETKEAILKDSTKPKVGFRLPFTFNLERDSRELHIWLLRELKQMPSELTEKTAEAIAKVLGDPKRQLWTETINGEVAMRVAVRRELSASGLNVKKAKEMATLLVHDIKERLFEQRRSNDLGSNAGNSQEQPK